MRALGCDGFHHGFLALCAASLLACSPEAGDDGSDAADGPVECGEDEVATEWGECLPWAHRYEPETRLDQDNVAYYAGTPLESLDDLPPPPRSGFRLITDPLTLGPFEQAFFCQSWQLPEIDSRLVYTTELHVSDGLHHANLFAIPPQDDYDDPQPSPACHPGAANHIGNVIQSLIASEAPDPDDDPQVLFANSTQIAGHEAYEFPDGVAIRVEHDELVLDTHYYNTTDQPLTVELVYDFYTMPEDKLEREVVPNVYMFLDFEVPPHTQYDLVGECDWNGGEVAAIMPHMHQWGVGYDVKFLDDAGEVLSNPYSMAGFNLPESDIEVFDRLLGETADATKVRFTCTIDNTTDHPMCNGTGENEMCFLFAYSYPPESRTFGLIPTDGAGCIAFNTGRPETVEPFDFAAWLAGLDPELQQRLLGLASAGLGDGSGNFSTCPDESPPN